MRTVIPLLAIVLGVIFAASILLRPDKDEPSDPLADTLGTTATEVAKTSSRYVSTEQIESPVARTDTPPAPTAPIPPPPSNQPSKPIGAFHVEPAVNAKPAVLGSNSSDTPYKILVDLTYYGPGIKRIRLTDFFTKVDGDQHYTIHQTAEAGQDNIIYPFQAWNIQINGTVVDLFSAAWNLESLGRADGQDTALYKLTILDKDDQAILDIFREFRLEVGSYDLWINQHFVNRSDRPLKLVWKQFAQMDITKDMGGYRGDQREYMAGHFNSQRDASRRYVYTDKTHLKRYDVLSKWIDDNVPYWPSPQLSEDVELVWLAAINRYFTTIVHPEPAATAELDGHYKFESLDSQFDHVGLETIGLKGEERFQDNRKAMLTLRSRPITLAVGQTKELNLGIFSGPRNKVLLGTEPYKSLGLYKTVLYSLGCTLCTFQPVANFLLWLLKGLHTLVQDWGVAIILLVLIVRTILHPITKKAQVNMMKMGKQMQSLQPELEKVKKKYENDKQKIGQETMKLYKEKGVNPLNLLGCLPMLLQTPIWIALYAVLYLAVELRHQSAFYGLFQVISGNKWDFLRDLSAPDRFITFFDGVRTYNIFGFVFDYSSFNILPILMAAVFFLQQLMTMTPAATDEQRRQQKMMRFMVLIFPVFMYSMPSGLTLYIMASTTIGVVESYLVRKHIRNQEDDGTLFDPKPPKSPKPGGWRDRMQKVMEARQAQMNDQRGKSGKLFKQRKRR